jgi:hypothetical protein
MECEGNAKCSELFLLLPKFCDFAVPLPKLYIMTVNQQLSSRDCRRVVRLVHHNCLENVTVIRIRAWGEKPSPMVRLLAFELSGFASGPCEVMR